MHEVGLHYTDIYSYFHIYLTNSIPIPAAALSKARVCGLSIAGMAGSNPAGARMSICCVCFVLLGREFCVVLITGPERRPKV